MSQEIRNKMEEGLKTLRDGELQSLALAIRYEQRKRETETKTAAIAYRETPEGFMKSLAVAVEREIAASTATRKASGK